MSRKDMGSSLIETLGSSGAAELVEEYAEIGLDAITSDDLIKEVPVVGTLVKLAKIGAGVRNYRFAKKLHRFLLALNETSETDRKEFVDRMNNEPATKEKVGEILIAFIDNFDEAEKSDLLAKAFAAYLQEEIPLSDLIRMARCLDRCLVSDLQQLVGISKSSTDLGESGAELAASGLLEIVGLPTIRAAESQNRYEITAFGERFRRIVLGVGREI